VYQLKIDTIGEGDKKEGKSQAHAYG